MTNMIIIMTEKIKYMRETITNMMEIIQYFTFERDEYT